MGIIINAGSENTGGTLEQAKINAEIWLKAIHEKGFLDVEMSFVEQLEENANFLFHFTHKVTKKVATLETHGFTRDQCKEFVFYPRSYWNGSSCSEEKVEDWLADGYKYKIVYYKE